MTKGKPMEKSSFNITLHEANVDINDMHSIAGQLISCIKDVSAGRVTVEKVEVKLRASVTINLGPPEFPIDAAITGLPNE